MRHYIFRVLLVEVENTEMEKHCGGEWKCTQLLLHWWLL
jgi:hypothetical protein